MQQNAPSILKRTYTFCFHLGVTLAAIILIVICALSCFGLTSQIAELCCHLTAFWLYAAIGVLGLVVTDAILLRRRLKIAIANAVLLIIVLGFVINKIEPLWSRVDLMPGKFNLTLLHLNLFGKINHDSNTFIKQINSTNPDIVAVSELTGRWADLLNTQLNDTYPYRFVLPANGLGIYSKYPVEWSELRTIKYDHRARMLARVKHPDVGPVTLLLAHPVIPVGKGTQLTARNEELDIYPDELKSTGDPAILVGDLNCTPWSPYFDKLIKEGNLIDSERGFGMQPSWPCIVIPPLLPIDHVLVSHNISVKERRLLAPAGSDHLPLLVKLYIGAR